MVIAIDGPAGTGKSTIAKLLAQGLGYTFINSGSFYRAITLGCLRQGINPGDKDAAIAFAKAAAFNYRDGELCLGEEKVENLLHTDEIDQYVAPLSAIVPIRHVVNDHIRRISRDIDIVIEGRDMTTVVFPDAEYRFYLDASAEARAERRFKQGVSGLSLDEIKEAILKRDEIDRNKAEGSLKIAPGVMVIDTSPLTINQVYDRLKETILKEGKTMAEKEVYSDTNPTDVAGRTVHAENIQTQLQEEYLKSMEQLEEGKLVEGKVIQVTQDHVFINIGYKSEGKIPLAEFAEPPKEGDKVTVILISKENKYGDVIISKLKADQKIFWKNLRQALHEHSPIEGKIEKLVNGGYEVDLGAGAHAFLPISQSDTQRVEEPEKFLGKKFLMYVERIYSEGKQNIVVNRRKFMEEAVEEKRNAFLETAVIGQDVTGVVKSFTSFGAFIDLGGFDGLLHINDISWGHVIRARDYVKKGQKIHLKVIRIDPAEKRINLSLKHFTDDPWVHFEEKYHVNDIVKGKVTKLTEFGAFIELEEGIEGLAHVSEFSWVRRVQRPGAVLSIGDETECMILGYDLQAGRVSLGLKQVTANPWNEIEDKYPVGTRLRRKVMKITNVGAFIALEDGIDGFLHADDISWTKKVKHPGSEVHTGEEIDIIVLAVDRETRSIRLGIKQLSEDPWQNFAKAYSPGSPVEGEVSSVTEFGLFVRVPGGIEGLIHKTNLVENRDENPDEALKKYKVGDPIKAVVLDLQADRQKLSFSIKDYQKKVQREELSHYMAAEESDGSTFTLGDLLKPENG